MLGLKIAARCVSDLLITTVYGAIAIFLYPVVSSQPYMHAHDSSFDIRTALLFAISFLVLSGLFISIVLVNAISTLRKPVTKRIIVLEFLFVLNVVVFYMLIGTSYSLPDILLIIAGLAVIAISEVTNERLWRGLDSSQPTALRWRGRPRSRKRS